MDNNVPESSGNVEDSLALHKLDDDSLLEIFSYLRGEDYKNLAKTSKRLKYLSMFKYHKYTFEFHSDMLSKRSRRGTPVVDVILLEYGAHIRSWALIIQNKFQNDVIEVLRRVSRFSTNLKRLEFKRITDMRFLNYPEALECLPNVETLSFLYCRKIDPSDFLQYFRNLKHLHFDESSTTNSNLQMLVKNNKEIEMLTCYGNDSTFEDDGSSEEASSDGLGLCEFGSLFGRLPVDNAFTDWQLLHSTLPPNSNDSLPIKRMIQMSITNSDKLKLTLVFHKELINKEGVKTKIASVGLLKDTDLNEIDFSAMTHKQREFTKAFDY